MSSGMMFFFVSLLLLMLLFLVKHLEVRRGARYLEGIRQGADVGALRLKHLIARGEYYVENIPWFLSALTRYGIHVGALSFARFARMSAIQAHRLADFVSHKRNFERKETKSIFLKQVTEHKKGNGTNGVETL